MTDKRYYVNIMTISMVESNKHAFGDGCQLRVHSIQESEVLCRYLDRINRCKGERFSVGIGIDATPNGS